MNSVARVFDPDSTGNRLKTHEHFQFCCLCTDRSDLAACASVAAHKHVDLAEAINVAGTRSY